MPPRTKIIDRLRPDATTTDQISYLQACADIPFGMELSALFSPGLVEWVIGCLKEDRTPDIFAEFMRERRAAEANLRALQDERVRRAGDASKHQIAAHQQADLLKAQADYIAELDSDLERAKVMIATYQSGAAEAAANTKAISARVNEIMALIEERFPITHKPEA